MNSYYKVVFLILCTVGLQSCNKARDAFGLNRHQPDEFTTMPRSNLQAPPTLALTPPQQGASRRGTVIADHQAQQILKISPSSDSAHEQSMIEKTFLNEAQSMSADPHIRHKISQDTAATPQQKPLINEILFWQNPQDRQDKIIDPHRERDETKKLIKQDLQEKAVNDEN